MIALRGAALEYPDRRASSVGFMGMPVVLSDTSLTDRDFGLRVSFPNTTTAHFLLVNDDDGLRDLVLLESFVELSTISLDPPEHTSRSAYLLNLIEANLVLHERRKQVEVISQNLQRSRVEGLHGASAELESQAVRHQRIHI